MKCPPPVYQSKGPVIFNGKTAPKGKSIAKGPTKGPIKSLAIQSQRKAYKSLSGTSVLTPPPVQLVVLSSPAGANARLRHVALSQNLPARSVNPHSLAVVMKEMKDTALVNGTTDPTLDEIEAEYQCRLALRYAAGLQLPPFMIGVTSPIISHALNVSGPSQLTEVLDYQSAGITNVAASHSGSLSLTGFTTHGNC